MSTKHDLSSSALHRAPAAGLFGSAKPCAEHVDELDVTPAMASRFADNFRAGTHVRCPTAVPQDKA